MKKNIKLNSEIGVDLEKLIEGGMVILANSGGGKSYAIRRIVEQAVDDVQIILLDPEGEFSSLREKFDFILAGKDADVPAEPRSAALLATKLLELNKSAVIDLYELHPQERQRFVKLFCDALVNCPKELYHPVIIILDEAHEYVPEGKPSEATWAVEALASKGRKRGQRLILASQRIAKISKNVTAEANNKLIGRASQDIDMKRAGDELGFSKDRLVELRQLKPGEFFAFGPAISDDVIKLKVGEVKTAHAKVGYKGSVKTPPPSDVIKKVLAELVDLPKEAEKEAKTIAEYKTQISTLKRELKISQTKNGEKDVDTVDKKSMERLVEKALIANDNKWQTEIRGANIEIGKIAAILTKIKSLIPDTYPVIEASKKPRLSFSLPVANMKRPVIRVPQNLNANTNVPIVQMTVEGDLTGPEQKVLNAIAWCESIGNMKPPQELVAFLSGYSHYRSTGYTNPRGYLKAKGLVRYEADYISLTDEGRAFAEVPDNPLSQEELHRVVLDRLDGPERKLLTPLLTSYPEPISHTDLCQMAGYMHERSTGYTNPRGRLKSFGLIEYDKNGVTAKELLFIE